LKHFFQKPKWALPFSLTPKIDNQLGLLAMNLLIVNSLSIATKQPKKDTQYPTSLNY